MLTADGDIHQICQHTTHVFFSLYIYIYCTFFSVLGNKFMLCYVMLCYGFLFKQGWVGILMACHYH